MVHCDEHTLELYVTGSGRVRDQRAAIEAHLAECATCSDLVARMREYYAGFHAHLPEVGTGMAANSGALARREMNVGPAYRRDVRTIPVERFGPLARAQRFVRHHPVAASAGSTFILGALGLLLYLSWPAQGVEKNPSYPHYVQDQGLVEIRNAENKPLWDLRANANLTEYGRAPEASVAKYLSIRDLDGDHVNEVITVLPQNDATYPGSLRIYDARKNLLREREFSVEFNYLNRSYVPAIDIGSMLVDDVVATGRPEIWVTGNSRDRSPGVTIRMDATGALLGGYWHFGQLREISCLPSSPGHSKQILLAGTGDADDTTHGITSVIVVLDPAKVTSVGRSTRNPGFHFPVSEAEEYYIELPTTDMNVALKTLPAPPQFRDITPTMILVRSSTRPGEDPAGFFEFDFLFDRDMKLLEVKSNNHTDHVRRELLQRGLIRGPIDRAYLDELKSRVRYWDGGQWVKEAVRVRRQVDVAQQGN